MNPDGTFVDEDGETENYHLTDVSENDRKRLHYLKKQQRKKDHGKKHRPRHRGPAPAPGGGGERREPRDPRVLKHHERSGRGMATKHRDAPGKVNRFQEHLHAREEDQERQRRERRKKRAEAKAQKARALRQTVVEDDDMGEVQDIRGWDHKDEQEARGREMARLDTRCRAREFVLTLPGGGCCGLYGTVRASSLAKDTGFNNLITSSYYINLDRKHERRRYMQSQFEEHGINPERFSALDKKSLNRQKINDLKSQNIFFFLSRG